MRGRSNRSIVVCVYALYLSSLLSHIHREKERKKGKKKRNKKTKKQINRQRDIYIYIDSTCSIDGVGGGLEEAGLIRVGVLEEML